MVEVLEVSVTRLRPNFSLEALTFKLPVTNIASKSISTPYIWNRSTDFVKTWKLESKSNFCVEVVTSTQKFDFDSMTRMVSVNIQFLLFIFLVSSSRAQVTMVDRFWQSVWHMTSFSTRMCHFGVLLICLPFRGANTKRGCHFQAKLAKR